MCFMVMMSWSLQRERKGTSKVKTIPKPEKIAPATKYGGKIVVCQPGTCDTAKSNDTTLCTESTSGVARAARIRYARSYTCQWRLEPRQPSDSRPYAMKRIFVGARSRKVARSGTMPMYQNSTETVAYVETANTSHNSGEKKFGHMPI